MNVVNHNLPPNMYMLLCDHFLKYKLVVGMSGRNNQHKDITCVLLWARTCVSYCYLSIIQLLQTIQGGKVLQIFQVIRLIQYIYRVTYGTNNLELYCYVHYYETFGTKHVCWPEIGCTQICFYYKISAKKVSLKYCICDGNIIHVANAHASHYPGVMGHERVDMGEKTICMCNQCQ